MFICVTACRFLFQYVQLLAGFYSNKNCLYVQLLAGFYSNKNCLYVQLFICATVYMCNCL